MCSCVSLRISANSLSLVQDPSYVPGPDMVSETKTTQYFPDVAAAALEVLRQQVTTEELKRFLRKMHDHQINPEQAEFATFELVYTLAERVSCLPPHLPINRSPCSQVTLLSVMAKQCQHVMLAEHSSQAHC